MARKQRTRATAQPKSDPAPWWLLGVALLGGGFALYAAERWRQERLSPCPVCGTALEPGVPRCPSCGTALEWVDVESETSRA